jgi:hypothetical protein
VGEGPNVILITAVASGNPSAREARCGGGDGQGRQYVGSRSRNYGVMKDKIRSSGAVQS